MKLMFLYQPVKDLKESVDFYRKLGFDEAWREGESTVAFALPGTEVALMLDVAPGDGPEWGPGPFFGVDSLEAFIAEHPDLKWVGEIIDVPGGRSGTFVDPSGVAIHLFDQSAAGPE